MWNFTDDQKFETRTPLLFDFKWICVFEYLIYDCNSNHESEMLYQILKQIAKRLLKYTEMEIKVFKDFKFILFIMSKTFGFYNKIFLSSAIKKERYKLFLIIFFGRFRDLFCRTL